MTETQSSAAATRQAIISAALRLFGEYGYNAVSTRKIAEFSDSNIGSIAYHFGGKPGLMRACALYVIDIAENSIGHSMLEPISDSLSPAQAREDLIELLLRLILPIAPHDDEDAVSAFIMRYISQPNEAFDLLFTQFITPVHRRLRQLLARATGREEQSEEMAILTFSLLGQSQYFKICRHIVQRSMNWNGIGPDECAKLRAAVKRNVNAIVDAYTVPAGALEAPVHQDVA